jgi:hypothetical protein
MSHWLAGFEIRNKFKSSNDGMIKTESRFETFFIELRKRSRAEHLLIDSSFELRISNFQLDAGMMRDLALARLS